MQSIQFTKKDTFARIPKTISESSRLSLEEKGLFCYLGGKPEGWRVLIKDVANRNQVSEYKVRDVLKSLRAKGYAALVRVREKGQIRQWVWMLADTPMYLSLDALEVLAAQYDLSKEERARLKALQSRPVTRSPDCEIPDVVPPLLVDRHNSKNIGKERMNNSTAADAGGAVSGDSAGGGDGDEATPISGSDCQRPVNGEFKKEALALARYYTTRMGKLTGKLGIAMNHQAVENAATFFYENRAWAAVDVVLVCLLGYIKQANYPRPNQGYDPYFYCRRFSASPSRLFQADDDGTVVVEKIASEVGYAFDLDADKAWETVDRLAKW